MIRFTIFINAPFTVITVIKILSFPNSTYFALLAMEYLFLLRVFKKSALKAWVLRKFKITIAAYFIYLNIAICNNFKYIAHLLHSFALYALDFLYLKSIHLVTINYLIMAKSAWIKLFACRAF